VSGIEDSSAMVDTERGIGMDDAFTELAHEKLYAAVISDTLDSLGMQKSKVKTSSAKSLPMARR
jgi:hypothetical protein